jgi:hypothetical protein
VGGLFSSKVWEVTEMRFSEERVKAKPEATKELVIGQARVW